MMKIIFRQIKKEFIKKCEKKSFKEEKIADAENNLSK